MFLNSNPCPKTQPIVVFEPENTKLFEESESKVPPLGIRILPDIVPWKLSVPAVRFDLTSFKKDTTNPEIYKQLYLQLISEYPLSEFFFTDSSKTELLRRLYPLNE